MYPDPPENLTNCSLPQDTHFLEVTLKFVNKFLRYVAYRQTGKQAKKKFMDLSRDLDSPQNLINCSLLYGKPFPKIALKSVGYFLRYLVDRHTNKQTKRVKTQPPSSLTDEDNDIFTNLFSLLYLIYFALQCHV